MPFADKFRAMMDFPFAGDSVGGFVIESVDVRHESGGAGRYAYPVRMVLRGPGGRQGVLRALKALFASHPMTFSGYGNPYQLWFGKPESESLGDQRYAVTVEGAGLPRGGAGALPGIPRRAWPTGGADSPEDAGRGVSGGV